MRKYITKSMDAESIKKVRALISELHNSNRIARDELKRYEDADGRMAVVIGSRIGTVDELRKALTEKMESKTNEARAKLQELRKEFHNAYMAQIVPTGDMISGNYAGEFALLANGLLATEADLEAFINRNMGNTALIIMASKYANDHGWHYSITPRIDDFNEFEEAFFKQAGYALENSDNYYSFFMADDNAVTDMIRSYNLINEYHAGNGEAYSAFSDVNGGAVNLGE